jgi:hypothetical protein
VTNVLKILFRTFLKKNSTYRKNLCNNTRLEDIPSLIQQKNISR